MIFAPRSCPSRPGFATTTRIFGVVLGAAMAGGRAHSMSAGALGGSAALPHPDRHLHAGRVDVADDRVRPGARKPVRHGALLAHGADRPALRALRDADVVREPAGPPEP